MTTHDTPSPTHISGIPELLAAVPYLLGFQPEDSLVIVGLDQDRLVLTVRLDLDHACEEAPDLFRAVERIAAAGCTAGVAITYVTTPATDHGPLPGYEAADLAGAVLDHHGLETRELLMVTGGVTGARWRSYLCDNLACCPPAGTPLLATTTEFQAAATYRGVVVADTRDALTHRFEPTTNTEALRALIHRAEQDIAAATADTDPTATHANLIDAFRVAALAAAPPRSTLPNHSGAARLGAALRITAVRDELWLAVDNGHLNAPELWLDLGRRLPAPYSAGPLFLYAWHAWRAGNSTIAAIAAYRALRAAPTYTAVRLLLQALNDGVNPRTVPLLSSDDLTT